MNLISTISYRVDIDNHKMLWASIHVYHMVCQYRYDIVDIDIHNFFYNNISVMLALTHHVYNININMTIFQWCWFWSILNDIDTISSISAFIWQYFSYFGFDPLCIQYRYDIVDIDIHIAIHDDVPFYHQWIRYRRYPYCSIFMLSILSIFNMT